MPNDHITTGELIKVLKNYPVNTKVMIELADKVVSRLTGIQSIIDGDSNKILCMLEAEKKIDAFLALELKQKQNEEGTK